MPAPNWLLAPLAVMVSTPRRTDDDGPRSTSEGTVAVLPEGANDASIRHSFRAAAMSEKCAPRCVYTMSV